MSISHWGLFPGIYTAEFSYTKGYGRAIWKPVEWDIFAGWLG